MTFPIIQEFVEVTREGFLPFLGMQFDGILGLGFQDIAVGRATPVWYGSTIIYLNMSDSKVFGRGENFEGYLSAFLLSCFNS